MKFDLEFKEEDYEEVKSPSIQRVKVMSPDDRRRPRKRKEDLEGKLNHESKGSLGFDFNVGDE